MTTQQIERLIAAIESVASEVNQATMILADIRDETAEQTKCINRRGAEITEEIEKFNRSYRTSNDLPWQD